jgi:hypothetical protein
MATCCQREGIQNQFGRKKTEKELRRFRRRGPIRSTQRLIDDLSRAGIEPALLVISDYTRIAACGADGLQWVSRAVSWDGIKILRADRETISGLAWDAPAEREVEFVIETTTGQVKAGPEPPASASLRALWLNAG